MKSVALFSVLGLLLQVQFAGAQQVGNIRAGLDVAQQVCSECHAVRTNARVSPNRKALAFQAIAETRGMTEMALRVWFQTAHPSMPNLRITGDQADDIIAYILSLKDKPHPKG